MRIAFYAPLKPPHHPAPSGDRRMARLLMAALGKHDVHLASRLRSYDGAGNGVRQRRIQKLGERLAARLVRRYGDRRPDLWFTYHLYHKAPDWLGPAVSRALAIPYVVAEASHAPKQQGGPWALGHAAVGEALAAADLVFGLNPADSACVLPLLGHDAKLVPLKPFLDVAPYSRRETADVPRLLCVAMMRPGDKLASYRVLGQALAALTHLDWRLTVVGDGPAREAVTAALAPIAERTEWLGERDPTDLYAAADIFVWPAVREAYGMALLEAQAAGLPVVAGAGGGVPGIVRHGSTGLLVDEGDAAAFADAVATLLRQPAKRQSMGETAARITAAEHGLESAAATLDTALQELMS